MSVELAIACDDIDCSDLLKEWRWIVPDTVTPIQMGIFGDWIFFAPSGSIWHLSALDGVYAQVAASADEFNSKSQDADFLNEIYQAEWASIAIESGLLPDDNQCLGWKVAPLIGGPQSLDNIRIFDRLQFNTIHGQVFRQMLRR